MREGGSLSAPLLNTLKADTFVKSSAISFTGGVDTGLDGNAIKSLGNVICPCCGLRIMDGEDINNLSKFVMNGPSKKALGQLAPFKDSMHEVERECFNLLEKLSEQAPDESIKDLLMTVRPQHLAKLRKIENSVMDNVEEEIKSLSTLTSTPLRNCVNKAREQINSNNPDKYFKRKEFIDNVNIVSEFISNKEIADKIVKLTKSIPSSGEDLSAFVVKFTQNKPENNMPRTSFDIAKQLLIPSQGTIEHIHPHSEGGKDKISNYLWECHKCNSKRGSDELPELKYIQQYMDEVIDIINGGGLKGYKAYPIEVAQALEDESKGAVKVDISALNIGEKEAENEIQNRDKRYAEREATGQISEKRNKNRSKKSSAFETSESNAREQLKSLDDKISYLQQPFMNHLLRLANAMPDKNLSQLYTTIRPVYEKRLIEKQNKIFDELDNLSKSLGDINNRRMKNITADAREKTVTGNFDREEFIQSVKDLTKCCVNKDASDELEKAVTKLPSPQNDLNAFIVDVSTDKTKVKTAVTPKSGFFDGLANQRRNMKPFEASVFDYLKQLSDSNPELKTYSLLQSVKQKHLVNLKEKEYKVLDEAAQMADKIEPKYASVIKNSLERYRRNLETSDNREILKRDFINNYKKMCKKASPKDIILEIKKKIFEMPTSNDSIDAFVVKYSGMKSDDLRNRLTNKR